MGMIFLSSYNPLIKNRRGKYVIEKHGMLPYVDDSCRREPDFESEYPSITALCRGGNFAPRVNESDVVIYITNKGKYPGYPVSHWRLTAILQVKRRFETHTDASKWYTSRGLKIPSNCIVPGNSPLPLGFTSNKDNFPTVERWDAVYRKRVRANGVFLVCKQIFLKLHKPPVITKEILRSAFDRTTAPLNPPKISGNEYDRFIQLMNIQDCLR